MAPTSVRVTLQLISLLFLAGSALLLFFIVLAGSKPSGILQKWYFLAADTSDLGDAKYPVSRWSFYGLCGYEKGESVKKPGKFIGCTKNKADYPFDPSRNFNIKEADLPTQFQGNKFYYLTRFQFPFYLIALFFDVVGLFSVLFSASFRSAGFVTVISVLFTAIFSIIAAALSTAAYVDGRNALHNMSIEAEIAPTLYGFMWAVVFMAIVNFILIFFVFPSKDGASSYKTKKGKKNGTPAGKRGGFKFGSSKKNTTVVDDKDASSFVRG